MSGLSSSAVGEYLATAYNAFVLIVAKGAFVANPDEGRRSNITIAYRAFTITLVAQTSDCNARLLSAHYKIAASD